MNDKNKMIITICSSAVFVKEVYDIKQKLENKGHKVLVYPDEVEINGKKINVLDYHKMREENLTKKLLELKSKLMSKHFDNIKKSDAILVLNLDKNGSKGYIGGNTFLEMGLAYYLKKKIFVWKSIQKELPYYEEIMALTPIIINENIKKIK